MRKKMRMLTARTQACIVAPSNSLESRLPAGTRILARNLLLTGRKNIHARSDFWLVVSATEIMASTAAENARPRETIWFHRYDLFLLTPHTPFNATSSGMNTPVEVVSSITTE